MYALSRVTNHVSRLFVPRMRSVENRSTHAQIGNLTALFAYLGACLYLSIIHCEALNPTVFKIFDFENDHRSPSYSNFRNNSQCLATVDLFLWNKLTSTQWPKCPHLKYHILSSITKVQGPIWIKDVLILINFEFELISKVSSYSSYRSQNPLGYRAQKYFSQLIDCNF